MKDLTSPIHHKKIEIEKMEWTAPRIKKIPTSETYSGIGIYQDLEGPTSISRDIAQ